MAPSANIPNDGNKMATSTSTNEEPSTVMMHGRRLHGLCPTADGPSGADAGATAQTDTHDETLHIAAAKPKAGRAESRPKP
jgi:hypothetical protein